MDIQENSLSEGCVEKVFELNLERLGTLSLSDVMVPSLETPRIFLFMNLALKHKFLVLALQVKSLLTSLATHEQNSEIHEDKH